jgi:hypothetical protein
MRLSILLLAACTPAGVKLADDTGGSIDDSPVDSETAEESAEETQEETAPLGEISDLQAAIHREVGSIVELTWTQDGAGTVHGEYSFDGGVWLSTPTYDLGAGGQRLLLLGIPYDIDVDWRLVVGGTAVADDATIHTDNPPNDLPEPDDIEGELSDPEAPWLFLSMAPGGGNNSPDHAWTMILDHKARVVWSHETPTSRTTFAPMPSVDGTEFLVDYNSWWGAFDGGVNSQVARIDIEGNELGFYDTPGLIHPFTQTGDGSIVWGASEGSGGGQGESLDILEPGGRARTLLDCNDYVQGFGESYCGSNALHWDERTGNVLFSLYSAETLLEVTLDGEVANAYGHMRGSWGFAQDDTAFWWQHGAHFLPDGHLLVSSRVDSRAEETVVREYSLDTSSEELVEVWSFGEGEDVWAYIMGEPRRLPGGNTLHNYGSTPRIREGTPEGDVVWDVAWDEGGTVGRMWVVSDLYAFWTNAP